MKPYISACEITVYALSEEDAEVRIEKALRQVEGFDDVTFDYTITKEEED